MLLSITFDLEQVVVAVVKAIYNKRAYVPIVQSIYLELVYVAMVKVMYQNKFTLL